MDLESHINNVFGMKDDAGVKPYKHAASTILEGFHGFTLNAGLQPDAVANIISRFIWQCHDSPSLTTILIKCANV